MGRARALFTRFALLLVCAIAVGAVVGTATAGATAPLPDQTVRGTVTDDYGTPIQGAIVVLTDSTTEEAVATTVTVTNGRYEFSGVSDGDYILDAYADGYLSWYFNAEWGFTMATTGQYINLSLNIPVVSGKVTVDGVPVDYTQSDGTFDLWQWMTGPGEWQWYDSSSVLTSVGVDGSYQMAVADPGNDFRVGWSGGWVTDTDGNRKYCYPQYLEGAVGLSDATTLTLAPNAPLTGENLDMTSSGPSISGTVTYPDTTPVAGKQVKIYTDYGSGPEFYDSTFTDDDGNYSFYGLPTGTYAVSTRAFTDGVSAYDQVWYSGDTPTWIDVTAGVENPGKDMTLGAPDVIAADGFEVDDTAAQASMPASGTYSEHTLVPGLDQDWMAIDVVAGHTYSFETTDDPAHPAWASVTDTVLNLRDSDGVSKIALNDDRSDTDSLYSKIVWTAPATKRIYAQVTSYGTYFGDGADLGSYRFGFTDDGVDSSLAHISGTLRDSATNEPIAGGAIRFGDGGEWVFTDGSGEYTVACLPGSDYVYAFNIPGHDDTRTIDAVDVLNPGDTATQDLYADPNTEAGHVKGTVTDGSSGLEGVAVTFTGGPSGITTSTVSDSGGFYASPELEPGVYSVSFDLAGYGLATQSEVVVSGGIWAVANQTLEAATTGSVTGVVHDATTGAPLAGATVACGALSAVSASDGTYAIASVPPGAAVVTFSKAGYLPQSFPATVVLGRASVQNASLVRLKSRVTISKSPKGNATYRRRHGRVTYSLGALVTDAYGVCPGTRIQLQYSANGKTKWRTAATLTTGADGRATKKFTAKSASKKYYRWVVLDSAAHYSATSSKQLIRVK